jgi:hypothetical protein
MSPDEADRFLDDVVHPTVDEFLHDDRNISAFAGRSWRAS